MFTGSGFQRHFYINGFMCHSVSNCCWIFTVQVSNSASETTLDAAPTKNLSSEAVRVSYVTNCWRCGIRYEFFGQLDGLKTYWHEATPIKLFVPTPIEIES